MASQWEVKVSFEKKSSGIRANVLPNTTLTFRAGAETHSHTDSAEKLVGFGAFVKLVEDQKTGLVFFFSLSLLLQ